MRVVNFILLLLLIQTKNSEMLSKMFYILTKKTVCISTDRFVFYW